MAYGFETSRPGLHAAILALAMAGTTASSLALLPMPLAAVGVVLGAAMVWIAAVDLDCFIIPDWLSLPAIPLGLLASGYLIDRDAVAIADAEHVIGAAVGFGALWLVAIAYRRLRGHDGLGFGDVKLAGAAGAWVGIELLAHVVLLAAGGALFVVIAITAVRGGRVDRTSAVPFGTFFAPAIWLVWLAKTVGIV